MGAAVYKRCCDCCELKDVDNDFHHRWKEYPSGVARRSIFSYCMDCVGKRSKAWAKANPERVRQRRLKYGPGQREYMLRREFGISEADYMGMLAAQGDRCAICRGVQQAMRSRSAGGRFHVDHDHVTGRVRGLLCFMCNVALGMFKDDTSRLRAAISYLERV